MDLPLGMKNATRWVSEPWHYPQLELSDKEPVRQAITRGVSKWILSPGHLPESLEFTEAMRYSNHLTSMYVNNFPLARDLTFSLFGVPFVMPAGYDPNLRFSTPVAVPTGLHAQQGPPEGFGRAYESASRGRFREPALPTPEEISPDKLYDHIRHLPYPIEIAVAKLLRRSLGTKGSIFADNQIEWMLGMKDHAPAYEENGFRMQYRGPEFAPGDLFKLTTKYAGPEHSFDTELLVPQFGKEGFPETATAGVTRFNLLVPGMKSSLSHIPRLNTIVLNQELGFGTLVAEYDDRTGIIHGAPEIERIPDMRLKGYSYDLPQAIDVRATLNHMYRSAGVAVRPADLLVPEKASIPGSGALHGDIDIG